MASVQDPKKVSGNPVTITMGMAHTITAKGAGRMAKISTAAKAKSKMGRMIA